MFFMCQRFIIVLVYIKYESPYNSNDTKLPTIFYEGTSWHINPITHTF